MLYNVKYENCICKFLFVLTVFLQDIYMYLFFCIVSAQRQQSQRHCTPEFLYGPPISSNRLLAFTGPILISYFLGVMLINQEIWRQLLWFDVN